MQSNVEIRTEKRGSENMSYTDDPVADAARYDAEQQAELDRLPKCVYCEEPIQDDSYFDINDEPCCYDCLIEYHRKWTDDYIR